VALSAAVAVAGFMASGAALSVAGAMAAGAASVAAFSVLGGAASVVAGTAAGVVLGDVALVVAHGVVPGGGGSSIGTAFAFSISVVRMPIYVFEIISQIAARPGI
jgi:hypothetical protein